MLTQPDDKTKYIEINFFDLSSAILYANYFHFGENKITKTFTYKIRASLEPSILLLL